MQRYLQISYLNDYSKLNVWSLILFKHTISNENSILTNENLIEIMILNVFFVNVTMFRLPDLSFDDDFTDCLQ